MFSHHAGTGPFTPDSDRATLRRGAGLQAALSGPERTLSKPEPKSDSLKIDTGTVTVQLRINFTTIRLFVDLPESARVRVA